MKAKTEKKRKRPIPPDAEIRHLPYPLTLRIDPMAVVCYAFYTLLRNESPKIYLSFETLFEYADAAVQSLRSWGINAEFQLNTEDDGKQTWYFKGRDAFCRYEKNYSGLVLRKDIDGVEDILLKMTASIPVDIINAFQDNSYIVLDVYRDIMHNTEPRRKYAPPEDQPVLSPRKKPRVNFDRFRTAEEALGTFIMEFYDGDDDNWNAGKESRATDLCRWLFTRVKK